MSGLHDKGGGGGDWMGMKEVIGVEEVMGVVEVMRVVEEVGEIGLPTQSD